MAEVIKMLLSNVCAKRWSTILVHNLACGRPIHNHLGSGEQQQLQQGCWWTLRLNNDGDEIIALDDCNNQIRLATGPRLKSLESIHFWCASNGLVCAFGSVASAYEILVFNPVNGSIKTLPHPFALEANVLGMAMRRDPTDPSGRRRRSYKVIIFEEFYIHTYSSTRGDWSTTLTENSLQRSTGVVVTAVDQIHYACDRETLVFDLTGDDWRLVRSVRPPFGSVKLGQHDVCIGNTLVDFRGRSLTVSGIRIGDSENSIAVWELVLDERIKSPWMLWRCMPYNLLKSFAEKLTIDVEPYQFQVFSTARSIGVFLKGYPELGGLAYDTKIDAWSWIPEDEIGSSDQPFPPNLCFQPDLKTLERSRTVDDAGWRIRKS